MAEEFLCGVIEGFYGRPWSWQEREETAAFLAPHGYGFYLYAPKADPYLRRRWQEDHPQETADALRRLASSCRRIGVRFGVGLSPYELYLRFDEESRQALAHKLAFFDDLGVEDLAILFDDMRGDLPDLADRQIEIVHWAAERSGASRVAAPAPAGVACPSSLAGTPSPAHPTARTGAAYAARHRPRPGGGVARGPKALLALRSGGLRASVAVAHDDVARQGLALAHVAVDSLDRRFGAIGVIGREGGIKLRRQHRR
jgi:hypothetical protein